MNTRHLPVDRVSLSGIRGERDGPERLNVGGKGERGEEGEEGDSSHAWGRWEGREGDPGQITQTVPSEYIYDHLIRQPVRRRAGKMDSSAITCLVRVDQLPRNPVSGKVRKAPSRWDTSLFITTPTLFQLNAAHE